MPYADINGTQMFYESHGEGPALVFAHGRGGSHLSWWRQVPVFQREHRCITFDPPGVGNDARLRRGTGTGYIPSLTWRHCWITWGSARRRWWRSRWVA